jgi:hypothetical protein
MERTVTSERLAWGLQELSAATGLSIGLLRKQVQRGALRVTRVGKRNIVALDDWHAFLAHQTNASVPSQIPTHETTE